MGFKLKGSPYDKSNMNIAVYKKDLTDGSIGKSNHTGIIVQSGISPEEEQNVIAHEKVHQKQQANGDLDYDQQNFYWKGKTYPRENLNEHNENLPWEKEAYKASEKSRKKQTEMGSTKFKLKGYRGNNKPFKHMTERGLIGASVDGASAPGEGDKEKVTKTTKTDVNPETGMKRFTTTTTKQSGSPGSKGTVSYEDAYKKADKSKYPTLEGFTKAAKSYKKKDVKVEEQIPTRKAKITTSSEPKLRTEITPVKKKTEVVEKKKKEKNTTYKPKKRKTTKYKQKNRKPQFSTKFSTSCTKNSC